MFLSGAPTSLPHKPIPFHENKLASGWMQNRTMHLHYCKYWTVIAPYFLNVIFMPSLSKYDTRSQMALDIPLCALFDIYEPMLHASLSFSWLSYLEVEGSSWICGSVHVEAVGESTFSVNGAPNWWHHHIFAKFDWKIFFNWMLEIHFLKNVYNFSELS